MLRTCLGCLDSCNWPRSHWRRYSPTQGPDVALTPRADRHAIRCRDSLSSRGAVQCRTAAKRLHSLHRDAPAGGEARCTVGGPRRQCAGADPAQHGTIGKQQAGWTPAGDATKDAMLALSIVVEYSWNDDSEQQAAKSSDRNASTAAGTRDRVYARPVHKEQYRKLARPIVDNSGLNLHRPAMRSSRASRSSCSSSWGAPRPIPGASSTFRVDFMTGALPSPAFPASVAFAIPC